jgi:hypothetical protein
MSVCNLRNVISFFIITMILHIINYQLYMVTLQINIDSFINFSLDKGFSDPEALYGIMIFLLSALESLGILSVIKLLRIKYKRLKSR